MSLKCVVFLAAVAVASAGPAVYDPIISKLDPEGLRYGYIRDDDGIPHLVDSWIKVSDIRAAARYDPDTDNQYHLFTRNNQAVSQPLVMGNVATVLQSNFDASKPVCLTVHGFLGGTLTGFNSVLVPAILLARDCNVIVVDWGAGAHLGFNGITSARSVANFVSWLSQTTGFALQDVHIVGYSVGSHQAGLIGRRLNSAVGTITSLDAADRWFASQAIRATDGRYVEGIHTNVGDIGMEAPYGHVDFYPNKGVNMPGCATSLCDHYRSYFYLGESLATGGFTGVECADLTEALAGTCTGTATLQMGGTTSKAGSTGIYYLETNASPPFSRG